MNKKAIAGAGLGFLLAGCGSHAAAPHQRPGVAQAAAGAPAAPPSPVVPPAQAAQPMTAPRAAAAAGAGWWHPSAAGRGHGPGFQWLLDHPLNLSSTLDMGGGVPDAAGHLAPQPAIYDIDGILNPAATVAALHQRGSKVICYVEIGSAGNYYSAADEGIPVTYYAQLKAARALGREVPGYRESYLNINAATVVSIIESMIRQQCVAKGFDAVEPDIDDSYTDDSGFSITEAGNEAYDRMLAAYAHRLGLAWGQKNGDNDPAFAAALEPATDFLLTEECRYYQTCGIVTPPYVRAKKLVLDAEYTSDWGSHVRTDLSRFCPADSSGGLDGTLFTPALAGQRNPCW